MEQLRAANAGERRMLMGWVHRRRDLGGVMFIHLRDREGVTQVRVPTGATKRMNAPSCCAPNT